MKKLILLPSKLLSEAIITGTKMFREVASLDGNTMKVLKDTTTETYYDAFLVDTEEELVDGDYIYDSSLNEVFAFSASLGLDKGYKVIKTTQTALYNLPKLSREELEEYFYEETL